MIFFKCEHEPAFFPISSRIPLVSDAPFLLAAACTIVGRHGRRLHAGERPLASVARGHTKSRSYPSPSHNFKPRPASPETLALKSPTFASIAAAPSFFLTPNHPRPVSNSSIPCFHSLPLSSSTHSGPYPLLSPPPAGPPVELLPSLSLLL